MRVNISVVPPLPAWIDTSYGDFGFYKLGLCCWNYAGFDGAIEWINTLTFCTEPKYSSPSELRIWMRPGIVWLAVPILQINFSPPDITINNKTYNVTTGKNMPVVLGDL